ncbi:MAG: hypothetical protein WC429_17780 [Verrucomicrobiia bacterium]
MIDRPSRDKLATALRQYVSGRTTNDDLDDIDVDWRDRGAVAVKERAWCLYDDNCQHRAIGEHYMPRPARDEIGRWILFLHSDVEYTWPEFSFIRIVNCPMNLLTFGWWERRKQKRLDEFMSAGEFSVWPFVSRQDYDAARSHPRYLSGQQA